MKAHIETNSAISSPPDKVYREFWFPQADEISPGLVDAFEQLQGTDLARKTHLFKGRYENIYIDRQHLPGIENVIEFWIQCAAEVLERPASSMRCGFWFNFMGPGDITLPHSHDDDDEWLSGVYYLQVPENSGNLILHEGEQRICIEPEAGKLVLFSSSNVHEVTENKSDQFRLSAGMNFGCTEKQNEL